VAASTSERYDAIVMSQIDLEKERQRLTALYGGMEDLELEEIAAESESLTDVARQVLRSELSRRGIAFSPETTGPAVKDAAKKELPRPVIVRRYRDLPEASIAKSILDSAGIESVLVDDNIVRIDWFYSNLVGGIKILVREEDAETAAKLLEQEVPVKFDVDGIGEYEQPRCPNCKSMDVSFNGLDKRTTYTGLFVGLPIPITNKGWKCHTCGNGWENGDITQTSDPGPAEPH
jgi:hypothetical protein